jgi:uncharacterized membrane protein
MEAGGNVTARPITFSPGVGSSYGNGWRQLWKNFLELLLTGIIYLSLTVPVAIIAGLIFSFVVRATYTPSLLAPFWNTSSWGFQILSYVLNIVYFTPIAFGLLFVYMTAARGDRVEFHNIFAAFRNYGSVIVAGIFYTVVFNGISILLGLITRHLPLLGIPLYILWAIFCIIIACKLAFIPYLLLDRKMKAIESIKTSWRMTNGHAWKVFLIYLLAIPISIAGAICFGVGIIIAIMWIMLAIASLYHAVSSLHTEAAQPSPIKE